MKSLRTKSRGKILGRDALKQGDQTCAKGQRQGKTRVKNNGSSFHLKVLLDQDGRAGVCCPL